MSSLKILITGATGFIGGSILSSLVAAKDISTKHSISVIVRGEDKVKTFEDLGVKVYLFKDLDDSERIQQVASEHDIVIATASGYHTSSAEALILGLGERKKQTGKEVYYIHTSGTSNLADKPITKTYLESSQRIFSDKTDDIYAILQEREAFEAYGQRTTDLAVVETGRRASVQTLIIMSPNIYGIGTGPYNTVSIQIPTFMRAAAKLGHAIVVAEGAGVWDYVHMTDLASLYQLVLRQVLDASPNSPPSSLPFGDKGIIFSGTGRYSWLELSTYAAEALHQLGLIPAAKVVNTSLAEAAQLTGFPEQLIELGFASNSRTSADVAKDLGWAPEKTAQDFKDNFLLTAKVIFKEADGGSSGGATQKFW